MKMVLGVTKKWSRVFIWRREGDRSKEEIVPGRSSNTRNRGGLGRLGFGFRKMREKSVKDKRRERFNSSRRKIYWTP